MPRAKHTISRDSVFRGTGPLTEPLTQGTLPPEVPNHQTAVWLGNNEIEWLDSRCQEIRRAGWRSITRSALIRAIIRAAMEQQIDLSGTSGETELTQRLSSKA